jgi:hypothetical protein
MPEPRTREIQAEGVNKRLTPRSRSLVADPHYSRGHLHAWKPARGLGMVQCVQAYSVQVGIVQVRPVQVGLAKIGPAEVGSEQVRPAQVRPAQIGPAQLRPA